MYNAQGTYADALTVVRILSFARAWVSFDEPTGGRARPYNIC